MPTQNEVHVDGSLTNISIAYAQDAKNFVADKVFPIVPVAKQSDLYWVYDKGDLLRDSMGIRADGTESAGDDYGVASSTPYFCPVRALHKDIGDQERANTDNPLDSDRDAAMFLSNKSLINRENSFASAFMVSGVWGTDVTPGTLWSAAASTPIQDIQTGKATVLANTGQEVNKIVCGYDVYTALMNHADIVGRMVTTSPNGLAMIGVPQLAALFGVDEFLVMKGVYNSAAEGATPVMVQISAKDMLLVHTATTPSLRTPSAGYTFNWTGYINTDGMSISKFRMDAIKSDRVEIETVWDHKVVASDCGYFFDNAVA